MKRFYFTNIIKVKYYLQNTLKILKHRNVKMKILLFGALLLWFMQPVHTFWWWFSSNIVENETFSKEDSSIQTVKSVFAPFEISIVEQKFLQEANTYLSNLPVLDQCNLLVSLVFCFFLCY